jgi:Short C-terminal domain
MNEWEEAKLFRARRIMRRAIAARRAKAGPPEAHEADDAAPPAEPVERVKELDELREQGILTEEEFAAEKKKLLGM